MTRPVRQNTSWLLLPDARGDSTPTTFSHLDRSSRLHHSTAETPITPSVRKHHAGLQSFQSMRRIEARRKNANATRLRFSHLQFIIARRAEPGKGVVFVTPLRGDREIAAATQVGFNVAQTLHS